ncbi:MAG: MBL fold metallo-hydrolase [Cyclobacteriaceae bacterium]|nr:MBL fold metallo-hydrolase [Cyclobacteriaceae bacterium HetDA_MAG_MS6]
MKITFLGTGTSQGVPVIGCECETCRSLDHQDKRLRSSVLVQIEDLQFVIDTGPDFRQQMLRERVRRLDAVLYTHEHKDHTAGLDDVRSFNFLQQMDMPLFAHERVITQLHREYSYIFAKEKYPGVPRVQTHLIENKTFKINNLSVTPIEVMHYKLPVFGFRIHDFTYITDANHIAEEEIEKIKGSKVLVLNALQKTDHISHFTLDQAIAMAEKIGAEKTYLTHISHKLGRHRDVRQELPEGVELAFDGLKLSL